MKLKTLKAVCTKRYGKFNKLNGLNYVNMKISTLELELSDLKRLKQELEVD